MVCGIMVQMGSRRWSVPAGLDSRLSLAMSRWWGCCRRWKSSLHLTWRLLTTLQKEEFVCGLLQAKVRDLSGSVSNLECIHAYSSAQKNFRDSGANFFLSLCYLLSCKKIRMCSKGPLLIFRWWILIAGVWQGSVGHYSKSTGQYTLEVAILGRRCLTKSLCWTWH